jgi:serine/threonine-protein kinase
MIGTCLMGKYDIIDVIGHGGMGVVYKGRQVLMDRTVAIKMLQSQHISDSMSVKRFHQEGKASSKMNHPNVITVYDFGVTPTSGQPFIVMDYLQGLPLSDLIKELDHIGVERSLKILIQASDALDHAHRNGVIHRDLKPSNIMLIDYEDEHDFVKVVDFGVAKLISAGGEAAQRLTQLGEVCGSPVYMSPEQVQGIELDSRSDIYSMGIVIYETLTGRLPIIGKTMVDTMSKHISEMPPRFSEVRPDLYIPERIEAVVFKALAKNPADRQQTMAELTHDLDTAIPRAGKSMILRSDFPAMPGEKKEEKAGKSKLSPVHWGIIAACTFALLAIGAKIAFDAGNKAKEAANPPAIVKPLPPATTPQPTAATVPGTEKPVTATIKSPATTTTLESGTSTTNVEPPKVAIKKVSPKPVVAKVAKKPKKPVRTIPDEDIPRGAGAAAAHFRSTAASGDPFSSLKGSRSY